MSVLFEGSERRKVSRLTHRMRLDKKWMRKGVRDHRISRCLRTVGAQASAKIGQTGVAYAPWVRKGAPDRLNERCLRTVGT